MSPWDYDGHYDYHPTIQRPSDWTINQRIIYILSEQTVQIATSSLYPLILNVCMCVCVRACVRACVCVRACARARSLPGIMSSDWYPNLDWLKESCRIATSYNWADVDLSPFQGNTHTHTHTVLTHTTKSPGAVTVNGILNEHW